MSSKLGMPEKGWNQREPRYGDRFYISAIQLHAALVTAIERKFKRSLKYPINCEIYVSAIFHIHRNMAEMHNEEKEFVEQRSFLLSPVFVEFGKDKSVTIAIPELSSQVDIPVDTFSALWEEHQPLMERLEIEEERAKGAASPGQQHIRIDPVFLNAANRN